MIGLPCRTVKVALRFTIEPHTHINENAGDACRFALSRYATGVAATGVMETTSCLCLPYSSEQR